MHNWNQSGPLTARLESSVENPWPVSSSQQEWWAEVSGVATAWMWYERRIESFISILMKVSLLPFFQQCSPWPDVPYQMNNAPSPSYNSSPNSFNLGDGYVTNKCFIFPVDTVAFVCVCFVCPCISYPGRRGQGPPFLEGRIFPTKPFKTFHPGIPCNAEYSLYVLCLCGGWEVDIRGPPGQFLPWISSHSSVGVREHTMACTSNSQYLLTGTLEAFGLQHLFRVGISSFLSVLRWFGVLNSQSNGKKSCLGQNSLGFEKPFQNKGRTGGVFNSSI